jgi:outer membrane protein assembly factor BamB
MSPARGLLILILLATLGDPGYAQDASPADWPHLRGPNYDAISPEKGLAETWPASGPPVLWVRDLGSGYSGFVAVGERVYTQFQTRLGQFVIALDADSGNELWRQRVDMAWQPGGSYPGPYATPTWYGGQIYYATPSGQVGCLDAVDGRQRWSVDVRKKFRGEGIEFGFAATPLVEGRRVILPVGGKGASVVALDIADGSTIWTAGNDAASYCPALPISFRGRRLVVAFMRNTVVAHDLATGELIFRRDVSSNYDEHAAWPLYVEPNLFISAPFRAGAQFFRLDEMGTSVALHPVWANKNLSNDVCSSVHVAGHVYGFDMQQAQASLHRPSRGQFKCLEFATGRVEWETDQVGQATVLAADGKLILLNETGNLILARANPNAYEELARARLLDSGLCWTPPTLSRGRLFIRNHERAMCVYLGRPETLDPNREFATVPKSGPRVNWAALLTREPEFPNDAPPVDDLWRWFGWCGVNFAAAGLAAAMVWLVTRVFSLSQSGWWARIAFAVVALALGLAGTSVVSMWTDRFVFTWPMSLYLAFRVTLAAGAWATARRGTWRGLTARAVLLLFIAVCFGYYQLCLAVGYVVAWGFLGGLLPATPFAVLAARTSRPWLRKLADLIGFATFFWIGGLLPAWKDKLLS